MSSLLLACRGVHLGYGSHAVVRDVDLELHEGELLGVVGPNGSGKSTFLRTVTGAHEPLAGTVEWSGSPRFGYVPQQDDLDVNWPLNVRDLVAMGRFPLHPPFSSLAERDREHIDRALSALRLKGRGEAFLRTLSGGEFQRVLLARALAGEPDVVLLDEPTAAVDLQGTGELLRTILELQEEREWTVILVSHDLNLVGAIADRLALLHDGRMHVGEPDQLLTRERLETVFETSLDVITTAGDRRVVLPDLCTGGPSDG